MIITRFGKIFFILLSFIFVQCYTPTFAVKEIGKVEDVVPKYVGSITFEHVLKKAAEHAYDLKLADFEILIAKTGVKGARSEYFPKLNLGAGTEYTKNYRDALETTVMSIGEAFINPYTRYQSVLGITLSYNVFDFGIRGGNLKIAKEEVLLKELEEAQKKQEMNLNLVDTYSKILLANKQIELNRKILALDEKNLEYKTRLFNAKEISKTELNDAKVKVSITKNKISELQSMAAESVNWLAFYTGEEYDAENLKVADMKKPNFDVTAFKDYTKSVIWKVSEKQIKKKELELKVAKRNNYPKVNAYSRYYLYGSDHNSYPQSFDDFGPSNFSVGGSISMPIFDGMKNSAYIQKTKLELEQLHVERDKSIAQLMTRLATMRANLIYLNNQLEENEKIITELTDKEKSVKRLAEKRIATPIDENDAQISLLEQKIESEKNRITSIAITQGIQILTEENESK